MIADSDSQMFVQTFFQTHYHSENRLQLPRALEFREIAWETWTGNYIRNERCWNEGGLIERVQKEIPKNLFYSSTHYLNPAGRALTSKHPYASDWIIDLDSHEVGSLQDRIRRVRGFVVRLVEQVIEQDLGFGPEEYEIVFSGSKGYHVHLLRPSYASLGRAERELFRDYLVEPFGRMFARRDFNHTPKLHENSQSTALLRDARRMFRELTEGSIEDFIQRWDPEHLFTGEQLAVIARELPPNFPLHLNDCFDRRLLGSRIIQELIRRNCLKERDYQIDRQVLIDLRRLTRIIGSLHGKTGWRIEALTIDQLRDHEIAELGSEQDPTEHPIWIQMLRTADCPFAQKERRQDELYEVSTRTAIFHLLQDNAILRTSTNESR